MSFERKRPTPIDAAYLDFLPEPLTQSPMTAETPVLVDADDKEANPHLQVDEEAIVNLYVHTCEQCSVIFDCDGDQQGNRAVDLCVCEQAIMGIVEPRLVFFCSHECSEGDDV